MNKFNLLASSLILCLGLAQEVSIGGLLPEYALSFSMGKSNIEGTMQPGLFRENSGKVPTVYFNDTRILNGMKSNPKAVAAAIMAAIDFHEDELAEDGILPLPARLEIMAIGDEDTSIPTPKQMKEFLTVSGFSQINIKIWNTRGKVIADVTFKKCD